MSLADALIQSTDNGDGSAEFTLSFADDDYRFSVSRENGHAVVEYEETCTWRGQITTAPPDEDVYKELMQSREMTEWLEANDLDGVRRGDR